MSERYDVAIVGARVAGSTLAALLGRLGLRVLLLDRTSFPSDTLSTHLIFGDSFAVWEEAGAWPAIVGIGAMPMEWLEWHRLPPNTNLRVRIKSVGDHDAALCLRRIKLDAVLFENAARTPGVTALEATKATELVWERDRVCGLRYTAERGRGATCTARASVIVGADGRFSFVGDAVEAAFYNVVPPQNFPFYTYYRGVEPVDPPVFPIWESSDARGTVMLVPCDEDIWMGVVYTAQAEYDTSGVTTSACSRSVCARIRAWHRSWCALSGSRRSAAAATSSTSCAFPPVAGGARRRCRTAQGSDFRARHRRRRA